MKKIIIILSITILGVCNCNAQSLNAVKSEVLTILRNYDNHTSCYPDKSYYTSSSSIDIQDYEESGNALTIYGNLNIRCYPANLDIFKGIPAEKFYGRKVPLKATIKTRENEIIVTEIFLNSNKIYPRQKF